MESTTRGCIKRQIAWAKQDLVLLVGKKLDFSLRFGQPPFFSEECRFIQIDADPSQLRSEKPGVLTIHAEPTDIVRQLTIAAQALNPLQTEGEHDSWRMEVMTARRDHPCRVGASTCFYRTTHSPVACLCGTAAIPQRWCCIRQRRWGVWAVGTSGIGSGTSAHQRTRRLNRQFYPDGTRSKASPAHNVPFSFFWVMAHSATTRWNSIPRYATICPSLPLLGTTRVGMQNTNCRFKIMEKDARWVVSCCRRVTIR